MDFFFPTNLVLNFKFVIVSFLFFIGKSAKKDISPAATNAQEKPSIVVNDAIDAQLVAPLEIVAASVVSAPKESPKNTANKEKPNKKKRNDALLVQQLGKFHIDLIAKK